MKLRVLVLTLIAFTGSAFAANDPHGPTYGTGCTTCHATHKSAGASLTNAISNESLCASCHNLGGTAAAYATERFVKADPVNRLGSSHAWNVPAESSSTGAAMPAGDALKNHIYGGNIVCSTCHDEHHTDPSAIAAGLGGTQTASPATRVAGSGSGTLTYAAASAASEKGYLVEIIEAGGAAGSARFRISNDGGISWYGYAGSWATYAPGNAALTGASVTLNDGANIVATFSGTFAIGDRFRFHVSYPFLRVALDSGNNTSGTKFCRDCHASRAMDHTSVNTWDGSLKSHPVGITLGANGGGYDRAVPLDANGMPQGGAGDGIGGNDLKLASDQTIQCLSCHAAHHADGNTATP